MELTFSRKLNMVIENGYANKIADFLPSLVEDYDIQKSIHGDMYTYTIKSLTPELISRFQNAINTDHESYISTLLELEIKPNYYDMLISVISCGFDGYVADLIAPKQLCSYDYTKGNVYDEMLTDLMPEVDLEDNYDDAYIARLNEAIVVDYNIGLNRKPVLNLLIGMPVLFNLNHKDIYDTVYRTIKYQFKKTYRLSEDKASRISNILACKSTKQIYNNRDIVTDINVSINLTTGELLYTLLGTGV